MTRAVVALDVGGTTVDAACISINGDLVGKLTEGRSPANGSREEILSNLAQAITAAHQQAGDHDVVACGIAMPGPFDYEAGVSHMVHKFQAIHGVVLGKLLEEKAGLPVYFINDASAFGLGASWRQLPGTKRFVALTIGTGLGGSFIENGVNVEEDDRVPLGGEVWDLPYKDGILEDCVSARGIVALYDNKEPTKQYTSKEVADLALDGDRQAIEAYHAMGAALGHGLAETFAHFAPEKIVIGGKVGQSLELYKESFSQALADAGVPVPEILQALPGNLAIWGAAKHAFATMTL